MIRTIRLCGNMIQSLRLRVICSVCVFHIERANEKDRKRKRKAEGRRARRNCKALKLRELRNEEMFPVNTEGTHITIYLSNSPAIKMR